VKCWFHVVEVAETADCNKNCNKEVEFEEVKDVIGLALVKNWRKVEIYKKNIKIYKNEN